MCISLPAYVLQVDEARTAALVQIGEAKRHVSLAVLMLEGEPVNPGDWLLVNAGLALGRLGEAEARRHREWIEEVGLDDLAGGDR